MKTERVQLATMRRGEWTFRSACLLSEAEMISDIPNADARMGRRRTGDIVWNVNMSAIGWQLS